MCDTPFKIKTPLLYQTSNSDNEGSTGTGSSNGEISLAAEFDDLIRHSRMVKSSKLESMECETLHYTDFAEQVKQFYVHHYEIVNELKRVQALVDAKVRDCSDLKHKLMAARNLLDLEKHTTRTVRKERDELAAHSNLVRDLLLKYNTTSSPLSVEEILQKLPFLQSGWNMEDNNNGRCPQLSAIKEINSTGSILSEFSYSRSETDLDDSSLQTGKAWKKHRPSTDGLAEPAIKKRRSSGNKAVEIGATDTVRATTTLTVSTATSIIESVPKTPGRAESAAPSSETYTGGPPANLIFESWARESRLNSDRRLYREHCFQQRLVMVPEICTPCEKRIRFGKSSYRCKECKAYCHLECKDELPLPCIPLVNTPNQKNMLGVIGDYTPTLPPMVPGILIHCINEIELRGLTEIGLYRIPGAERAVKALKERFLKGKRAPCLNKIDIHVICGTVKDFLKSLHEPLVTCGLWKRFVEAVEAKDPLDVQPALYQVISELPQPNRDTLAYMILHLQKVSEARECKMNVSNLAKVFGPTIVGFFSKDPNPATLMDDLHRNTNLMEQLIQIPSDYWATFINVERASQPSKLQQTPSTDSLLRPMAGIGLFTPLNTTRNINKKIQKYFPTPKNMR